MKDYESWLTGIVAKRSLDVLRVLCDLVDAGLANGECSANDVRDRTWKEPNVIGAAFKLLHRTGFATCGRVVKSTALKRHGGFVFVWLLVDQAKAVTFKAKLAEVLQGRIASPPTQLLLEPVE